MMMMVEGRLAREVGSFLEFGEEVDKEGTSVYVGALLPDELVERILAYLPPLQAFSEQDVCVKDGMRLLPLKGFYGTLQICCHRNLGTLCLLIQMNQLVMLIIPPFGNGMALNFL